jgi:hypothetical protein
MGKMTTNHWPVMDHAGCGMAIAGQWNLDGYRTDPPFKVL